MPILQMTNNPWAHIENKTPFILPDDGPYVDAFNRHHKAKDGIWINPNHPPEPRLGPVSAPVYILQLNPSYDKNDLHGNNADVYESLESAKNENRPHSGVVRDDNWWAQTLGPLMRKLEGNYEEKSVAKEALAHGICSVEFFPYRSMKFSHGQLRLPSQGYTFNLVRSALKSEKLIVVTRNFSLWLGAIPELANSLNKTVFLTKNPQRPFISEKNLPEGVFDKVVSKIFEHNKSLKTHPSGAGAC